MEVTVVMADLHGMFSALLVTVAPVVGFHTMENWLTESWLISDEAAGQAWYQRRPLRPSRLPWCGQGQRDRGASTIRPWLVAVSLKVSVALATWTLLWNTAMVEPFSETFIRSLTANGGANVATWVKVPASRFDSAFRSRASSRCRRSSGTPGPA